MNLPRENPTIRATDPFARPDDWIAWRQVTVISGLFILTLVTLYWGCHSWWQWALIPVLASFLVRMFVLFHDCGHGSLFRSYRANAWVGSLFGYVTSVPFHGWHTEHACCFLRMAHLADGTASIDAPGGRHWFMALLGPA